MILWSDLTPDFETVSINIFLQTALIEFLHGLTNLFLQWNLELKYNIIDKQ